MPDSRFDRAFDTGSPQTIPRMIASYTEPAVTVLVYLCVIWWFDETFRRIEDITLLFLVGAITYPGVNRFRDRFSAALVGIVTSWIAILLILALLGFGVGIVRVDGGLTILYFDARVLLFWSVITPLAQLLVVRLGHRLVMRDAARPENRRGAVVIGAGPLGVRVSQRITESREHGQDVLGYFDDRSDLRVPAEAHAKRLGSLRAAAPYIRAHGVKVVYITLPLGSQPRIIELLENLQGTTASIYFVPDVFGITIIQGRIDDVNGLPVVAICETPFTGANLLFKRVSDFVLASIIVVLIAPVLLAVAVGVKLSSPGPIIFKQRRNGLDGEEIIVYKFRSMRTQDNGAVVKQATKGDPRVTPFGAFIRRTSLDELPQFINVLQGRMSIVGPRPHAVAHNEQYRELIKAYMVRHKVKPGITGWAQVNGLRGETDTIDKMKSRVEYDIWYLRNWSLKLDLRIIAYTIKSVISDGKAY